MRRDRGPVSGDFCQTCSMTYRHWLGCPEDPQQPKKVKINLIEIEKPPRLIPVPYPDPRMRA